MTIPVGFSIVTFTWNQASTSRNVVCTFGSGNGAATTPAAISLAWRVALVNTAARPFTAATLSSVYTLVEIKCLANIGGVLLSSLDSTPVTHTGAAAPPPMNTAMLVNKVTGLAGRKYRGRIFSPWPVDEANVTAYGTISAPQLATAQATWDNALIALNTAGYQPHLLHTDGSTPTPITSFTVSQKIGTIGRRLRG